MPGNNRAVFMDRDGTIVADPGYLTRPDQLELLPGAADAIARLRQAGFLVVLTTNQSAIARGMMTEADLAAVHERLTLMLAETNADARLDAIYYCPYHPEATVSAYRQESYLRKPRPGMLFKAARDHQLDLGSCWMVGDSERDVQAGKTAGCRAVRIDRDPETETMADKVLSSLADAAELILSSPGRTPLRRGRKAESEQLRQPSDAERPAGVPGKPDEAAPAPSESPPDELIVVEVADAAEPVGQSDDPVPTPSAVADAAAASPVKSPAAAPQSPPATVVAAATGAPVESDKPSPPAETPPVSHAARALGSTRQRLLRQIEEERQRQVAGTPAADRPEPVAAASSAGSGRPAEKQDASEASRPLGPKEMRQLLADILQQLRQLNRGAHKQEISATKIIGGLFQALALGMFAVAMVAFHEAADLRAVVWSIAAVFMQLASVTFFVMFRQE